MVNLIAVFIGILAGSLSLTALIDQFVGTELTSHFLGGIWDVLQFLISPILSLFSLIWDKLIEIVRAVFF